MSEQGRATSEGVEPVQARRKSTSTARGSITVSIWTMVSRLTGLLRVVVIGAVLGPTYFANAFLSANSVPNLTYTAVAGPVMALVLVPAIVSALSSAGQRATADVVAKVSGYLLTVATAAAAGLALISPLLALAVTAGIPDPSVRTHAWKLTILVVLFVAPQVIGYAVAGIGEAVQQACGRFALASAAPALENFGLIATMGLFALVYPPGVDVMDVSLGMVLLLGIGATLSVALHAGAQVFGAHRVGLPIRLRRGWRSDPTTSEVTRRLRSSVIVAGFPSLSMFAMLALASTVPGGTFVFQTGMSMYFMLAALGPNSVTVAALPGMSAAVEQQNSARYGAAWRQALSFTITASLPATCLLLAFARPVADVLANGKLANPQILGWLTGCLAVFAVAQFANSINVISRQAMFTRFDVRKARTISTVILAVRVAVGGASLLLPVGLYRLLGLCGAVLLGEVVAAVLGLRTIRTAIKPQPLADYRRLGYLGLAVPAMLPALAAGSWLARQQASMHPTGRLLEVLIGLVFGGIAIVCFGLVVARLTGQLRQLLRKVRARLLPHR
jgi:peptidoglycan biosynthesis protein MviN/MurJ (putative lipid II flippase)